MALTAFVNYRLRAGAAETNSGGFDPSLTAGMLTDLAATSATGTAPVVTSATYTFVAGDVGHFLYIAAGTNWTPGWYPIASVTAGAATLTASVDSLRGGALLANNTPLTTSGCATTASPTGGTFTIDYSHGTAPFLSLTDLASTASTTVTSASAPFTPVMIGNLIRLASATGSPVADSAGSRYLAITTYTDASNVVVDKQSGTYTAGVAKVGGSFATFLNLCTGSTGLGTILLTSPLLAGNTIKIWGAGSEDPTAVDFDLSAGYYSAFPNGTTSSRIHFLGINGRPRIDSRGLVFYLNTYAFFKDIYYVQTVGTYTTWGFNSSSTSNIERCVLDQNGFDAVLFHGTSFNCKFINRGSRAAGTQYAYAPSTAYGQVIMGNIFDNIRGGAVSATGGCMYLLNNIITRCRGTTISSVYLAENYTLKGSFIIGNTIDRGEGDGIKISHANDVSNDVIRNNIISNHLGSGKYGINISIGTTAANDSAIAGKIDYNNFYNNTADRNAHSAGLNDVALDPGYTNPYKVATVTMTIASPAVASLTAHGLAANDVISFTTTGALPTGVTAGTPYYVISAGLTADAFEFSATLGGAAVNTSGSQSGTHTLHYYTGTVDYSVGTNMKAVGFPNTFPA